MKSKTTTAPSSLPSKMTSTIDISKATSRELLDWYNANSGAAPLVKFASRSIAETRCAALYEALKDVEMENLPLAQPPTNPGKAAAQGKKEKPAKEEKAPAPAKAKAEKAPKAEKAAKPEKPAKEEKEEAGARGRRSEFSGRKIHRLIAENPRREGTHGRRSWDLIKDGMTYEEYIAAGGRANDLRHDLNLARVEIRD